MAKSYSDKLKDPRWQKRRLAVLERDEWCCQSCYDTESTLHVHHRYYVWNSDPWDYPEDALVTLCESCHADESAAIKEASARLFRALRTHFLADELNVLADALERPDLVYVPSVVAEAIAWVVRDSEVQREMIERYLATLRGDDG